MIGSRRLVVATPGASAATAHLIGPNPEAVQRIGAERGGDGDVCGITAARQKYSADTWHIVARIERVPLTAEIGFEPGCEIAGRIGRRRADVAQIARAVAGGYIQCTAERDR